MKRIAMDIDLDQQIGRYFIRAVVRHPGGRIHVLNQLAEAERSSEGDIFDRLLARVDDPELSRMIARHRDDERIHTELFTERVLAHGGTPGPVPSELRIIDRIDRALDGFMQRPIEDAEGVMRAYLVLQVLEERAVTQFPLFAAAFRQQGDEVTASVLDRVLADEQRHLKYCHAISRRYAPDELTRQRTLAAYRAMEARCFADNSRANLRHLLDHQLVEMGPAARWLFRGFAAVSEQLGVSRPTPFAAAALAA